MPSILYTRLLWFAAGFTPCPWIIVINTASKDDNALLQHELVHVKQMKQDGLLTFWWRYATRKGRLAYEVEAYRVQITCGGPLIGCADTLCSRYYLGITKAEAMNYLTGVNNV